MRGKLETSVLEELCQLKQNMVKLEIHQEEKLEVKIEIISSS